MNFKDISDLSGFFQPNSLRLTTKELCQPVNLTEEPRFRGSDAPGSGLNLTGALRPVRLGDSYYYLVHHYRISDQLLTPNSSTTETITL